MSNALLSNSTRIAVAHNHPSGNLNSRPSQVRILIHKKRHLKRCLSRGAKDTKLELFFGRFTENKPTERPSVPKRHQDTRNSEYLKKQVQKINQIASLKPYREGTHIWCKVLY